MQKVKALRTVRLTLGFNGTRYEGWQSQRNGRTIQEVFEKYLSKILSEKIAVVGSSRTDSGVHAKGFVAHFVTESKLSDSKIKEALNFYLPEDIVVFEAKTARPGFHARFNAKSKIYQYDIWNGPTRPLFEAPFVVWYRGPLDISSMKKAARFLVGKHDFRAFKDSGDEVDNTVRTLKKILIQKKGPLLRFTVQGNGFLTHMVRILVGTLLEVGRGRKAPQDLRRILLSKNRTLAGPTVKAQGLMLIKVLY